MRDPEKTNQPNQRTKQQPSRDDPNPDTHTITAATAQTSPTPSPHNPRETTAIEEEAMEVDETSNASTASTPPKINIQPKIKETHAPHPQVPTNNGTHRATVKWTPPSDITEFETDKRRLNEALFTLMTTLFKDEDGVFYRWESEDMVDTKAASSLTEVTARDFVLPKVTIMATRKIMVFGLRSVLYQAHPNGSITQPRKKCSRIRKLKYRSRIPRAQAGSSSPPGIFC